MTRDSVRVRLPALLATGTAVRLKAPFRSRSIRGRVHDGSEPTPGAAELVISADEMGTYFGVVFPKRTPSGAKHEEEIDEAPVRGNSTGNERSAQPGDPGPVAQSLVPSESPPFPAPSLPQPQPVPVRLPEEAPARPVAVTIAGIDAARCPFSQPLTATLDAAGSLKAPMRQLLELGSRVRVTPAPKNGTPEAPRKCRVYSRSPLRTADGFWMYRLVFENALDLFRDFEPADALGAPTNQKPNPVWVELNTLRAALAALVYELRRKGVIEDDALLSSVLGREVEVEELTAGGK